MSRPVLILPAAEADIQSAAEWLDMQRRGLGRQFIDQVDELLRRIAEHPEAYATFRDLYRRAFLRQFPYAVIYILRPRHIEVIAVFHCKRHSRSLIPQRDS
jgi:plasmid stabilization system protein ParE